MRAPSVCTNVYSELQITFNGTLKRRKSGSHRVRSPPTQLCGSSGFIKWAKRRQFNLETLQRYAQWSFQLYQSNIVYILFWWWVFLMLDNALGCRYMGTCAWYDGRSVLNWKVWRIRARRKAMTCLESNFELPFNIWIARVLSERVSYRQYPQLVEYCSTAQMWASQPEGDLKVAQFQMVKLTVHWTFRSHSNHEWKGFNLSIRAIYNKRFNQIHIFSSAESRRKHKQK